MASRPPNFSNNNNTQRPPLRPIHTSYVPSFLSKLLRPHAPNSTQLMGFLTLAISGGILLLLTGVTLTTVMLGMIFFIPLLVLSSPIWIPIGTFLFISLAGFLSVGGFGAAITWVYRYLKRSPISRMEEDSSDDHGKDYAREFGGYLQGQVKDTAPGA